MLDLLDYAELLLILKVALLGTLFTYLNKYFIELILLQYSVLT